MSSKAPTLRVQFPAEVLLHIFDSLVPSHPTPIALPASDPITKTLLSLTLTSRQFYPIALRYLYAHCLYIDNSLRLHAVVDTLYLLHQRHVDNLQLSVLPHAKSLYFHLPRPINPYIPGRTLPEYTVFDIQKLVGLLALLKPYLQRLLFDLAPDCLHRFYRYHPTHLMTLRTTLASLCELEVICCSPINFLLAPAGLHEISYHPSMATSWPKLRVMAAVVVYDTGKEEFWNYVAGAKCLKTVVMVIHDSAVLRAKNTWIPDDVFGVASERKLNAVFVNVSHMYETFSDVWRLEKNVRVREVQFPIQPGTGRYRKESLEWIRSNILAGEECIES